MENVMLALTSITLKATQAKSPAEQVRVIVDGISAALDADVCSLYRRRANADMVLIASHGLATKQAAVIPQGMGLGGRVALARHSINLLDPEKEPDYFYLAESGEELFHSFCGVPLVQHGQVIGVLVVQRRRRKLLDAQGEAFLSTLASHLALLVEKLPDRVTRATSLTTTFSGISGASGLAVGAVRIVTSGKLYAVPDGKCDDPAIELQRWQDLRAIVVADLLHERQLTEQALGPGLAAIFDAYRLLLEDPTFSSRIEKEIGKGGALPPSIRHTVQYFPTVQSMDDPYLRARHEDIEQLGEKLYQALQRESDIVSESAPERPFILVGKHISVSDIVRLPTDQLQAIVCSAGGALSISLYSPMHLAYLR